MSLGKSSDQGLFKINDKALKKCFESGSLSYLTTKELILLREYIKTVTAPRANEIVEDVVQEIMMDIELRLESYQVPEGVSYHQAMGALVKFRIGRSIGKVLNSSGKKSEGILGMTLQESNRDIRGNDHVILVKELLEGGEAEKAGIERLDEILRIEGVEVRSRKHAEELLKSLPKKTSFKLTLRRKGEEKTLDVDPSDVAFDAHTKETQLDEAIWSKVITPQTRERQIYLSIVRRAFRNIANPKHRIVLALSVFAELKPSEIHEIDYGKKEELMEILRQDKILSESDYDQLAELTGEILRSPKNVSVILCRAKKDFFDGIVSAVDEALKHRVLDQEIPIYKSLKHEAQEAAKREAQQATKRGE